MVKIILLVLLSEVFMGLGHTLYKKTTNTLRVYNLRRIKFQFHFLKDVITKPMIWAGFIAMAIGLVVWLIALAQGDSSLVFPIGSLQFILVLFSARIFLNEKIDRMKIFGTFLVVLGIVLMTIS